MKIEDIVAKIAPKHGIKANDLMLAVTALFDEIQVVTAKGEKVLIHRVGAFAMKARGGGEKVDDKGVAQAGETSMGLTFKPNGRSTGGGKIKEDKPDKKGGKKSSDVGDDDGDDE